MELSQQVLELSRSFRNVNNEITRIKEDAEEGDLAAAEADLLLLKVTKKRFQDDIDQLCIDYLSAKIKKEQAERLKARQRGLLDNYRQKVIPRYQSAINELLRRFNADFRITGVQAVNPRGRPSSTYHIEINNERVPITGAEVPLGTPTFRNTLSSGDRNTLALAFFFAWLENEPNLGSVLVVIDDPISSLDDSRAAATAQRIRELAGRTCQTIVMSHSKPLLCNIWQHLNPGTRRLSV
jgi:wobble nucleotide-excising tRNase